MAQGDNSQAALIRLITISIYKTFGIISREREKQQITITIVFIKI